MLLFLSPVDYTGQHHFFVKVILNFLYFNSKTWESLISSCWGKCFPARYLILWPHRFSQKLVNTFFEHRFCLVPGNSFTEKLRYNWQAPLLGVAVYVWYMQICLISMKFSETIIIAAPHSRYMTVLAYYYLAELSSNAIWPLLPKKLLWSFLATKAQIILCTGWSSFVSWKRYCKRYIYRESSDVVESNRTSV